MSEDKAQPQGITAQALAKLFDCEPRTIQKLASKNIAVRVGRGRYNLVASTQNYIRHLRDQAAGRVGNDPNADIVAAGAQHKQAATRLLQMKIDERAGNLLPADAVRDMGTKISTAVRKAVLALPNRIHNQAPTLSTFDLAAIDQMCRDLLEGLAVGRDMGLGGLGSKHASDPGNGSGDHKRVPPAAAPKLLKTGGGPDLFGRGNVGADGNVPAVAVPA